MKKKSLIAIEARIQHPEAVGGVGQVVVSLAKHLSQLDSAHEEYVFIGYENAEVWLGKHIGGPCRLHIIPNAGRHLPAAIEKIWELAYSPSRFFKRNTVVSPDHLLRKSDGTIESLGADLVHFPTQDAYLTNCPSIYHPHDLQHFHMPEYFDANTLRWRLVAYRVFCQRAKFVCVESAWIKQDVVQKLDIPPENVAIIPVAPPNTSISMSSDVKAGVARKIRFPRFIFYPAQTWRHKNHLRLLDALHFLKHAEGLIVPLVCSGHRNEFFSEIQAKIKALDLTQQVCFLGFVGDDELDALYRLATAVVIPTKFESLSLPIWEAFSAGTPVACSKVTSLPEQVETAGLLFDPDDALEIAAAVRQLWQDAALRAALVQKGFERFKRISGYQMAHEFRGLYHKALERRSEIENPYAPRLHQDTFPA